MFIIDKQKSEIYSLPAKEILPSNAKSIGSKLAQDILSLVSKEPIYPRDIARTLKINEQRIYYHIRKLEQAGIIKIVKKETRLGTVANYYSLTEPAVFIKFKEFETTQKIAQIRNESVFLEPFIKNGELDSLIIVGSPDPHGAEKARSRDGYYGIDFALFLGTFLNYVPKFNVKLDTEIKDKDLKSNLILIGGPLTNKIVEKVNSKLPIKFEKGNIVSSISNRTYAQDECGLIVKAKNQFDKEKYMMVIAGKRFSGTRAAIIAFLKDFKKVVQGNFYNKEIAAKVVEGLDLDSDGVVDSVEFRE